MKRIAIFLATFALVATGCSVEEEPDSFSEQGKTTRQVKEKKKKKKAAAVARWKRNMNQVKVGMSQSEVKSLLGKPTDTMASESSDFEGGTSTYDSWTYGSYLSGDQTLWSLDFIDGKLQSKSRL